MNELINCVFPINITIQCTITPITTYNHKRVTDQTK